MIRSAGLVLVLVLLMPVSTDAEQNSAPYLLVLGVGQDGGAPQAGTKSHPGWTDAAHKRFATSLAIVEAASKRRWMFEASPDFREQLHLLDELAPVTEKPGLSGIFLTHAHMGHYTGLIHLGHEAMGARDIDLWVMPRMSLYLSSNGPWNQLVKYKNVRLRSLADGVAVRLGEQIEITPFLVPHRQEYSEVVGYLIAGPNRKVMFIPDIDSWEEWDDLGTRIEDRIAAVDVAYLDGSFFANGEIPGRDMSGFPHPFISHSMKRFGPLPADQKAKIRFIHLNHTNAALWPDSDQRRAVESQGFRIAKKGERIEL